MRKSFSILMIVAIKLPSLNRIGILIDFKINQDFIAKVLGINREKPMTMRNGKCYLSNQIQKAEEKEKKQIPFNANEKVQISYFLNQASFYLLNRSPFFEKHTLNEYAPGFYTSSFIFKFFRPPETQFDLMYLFGQNPDV